MGFLRQILRIQCIAVEVVCHATKRPACATAIAAKSAATSREEAEILR